MKLLSANYRWVSVYEGSVYKQNSVYEPEKSGLQTVLRTFVNRILLQLFVILYSTIFSVYCQGQYWTITLTTAVLNKHKDWQNRISTNINKCQQQNINKYQQQNINKYQQQNINKYQQQNINKYQQQTGAE